MINFNKISNKPIPFITSNRNSEMFGHPWSSKDKEFDIYSFTNSIENEKIMLSPHEVVLGKELG